MSKTKAEGKPGTGKKHRKKLPRRNVKERLRQAMEPVGGFPAEWEQA